MFTYGFHQFAHSAFFEAIQHGVRDIHILINDLVIVIVEVRRVEDKRTARFQDAKEFLE